MQHWGKDVLFSRRGLIAGAAGLLVARAAHAGLVPTPPQTPGPFYPRVKPGDTDADLTVIGGGGRAVGEVIEMADRVRSTKGDALKGSVVEIWQADANGRYSHPLDRGATARDARFQGYGAVVTDHDGRFRFRTIRPRYYDTGFGLRTPHIHVRVVTEDARELVTQMYFPGEPLNSRDGIYTRLPSDAARAAATAIHVDGDTPAYRYDIVIA